MVPDVLQDVHLVHGLDLLLLLLLLGHGLGRAHSGGNSWLSGERWLSRHWWLGLRLGLGFGFSPQVQNLVQVFFDSREPQGDALSISACRRGSPNLPLGHTAPGRNCRAGSPSLQPRRAAGAEPAPRHPPGSCFSGGLALDTLASLSFPSTLTLCRALHTHHLVYWEPGQISGLQVGLFESQEAEGPA